MLWRAARKWTSRYSRTCTAMSFRWCRTWCVADITFIRIARGVVYLAAILDACSRKVVGYAISRHIDTELTLAALKATMRLRDPPPGTSKHHTDQGSQGGFYRSSQH